MNTEPKSIDLEALSQLLDLDIAADAARPQKEIDDELKRRGLNPDELNRNATAALRKALKHETRQAVADVKETDLSFNIGEVLRCIVGKLVPAMGSKKDEERAETTFDFPSLQRFDGLLPQITLHVQRQGADANVAFVLHKRSGAQLPQSFRVQMEWSRTDPKTSKTETQLVEFDGSQLLRQSSVQKLKGREKWVLKLV